MKAGSASLVAALALSLLVSALGAQSKAAAVIEYSSGDDIVVIRSGRRLPSRDPIGLELLVGDQVQTGKGVFVEIRLAAGAVVKLAENTTFIFDTMADGQTALQLVYGRIRAKVERVAGTDSFAVRSSQAIAGVRGTDFGMDVVASRSSAVGSTTTRAYCFEGSLEVTALVRSDVQAAESLEAIPRLFAINAGEMLKIEGEVGKAEATKTVVEASIITFWTANDYVSEPNPPMPIVAETALPSTPEIAPPVSPAATATGAQPSSEPSAAFDEGYAAGYEDARRKLEFIGDAVPEGFLTPAELAAMKKSIMIQKGSLLAGSLISAGGAVAIIHGLVLMNAGDASGGADAVLAGAIMSIGSMPFFALSLLANP